MLGNTADFIKKLNEAIGNQEPRQITNLLSDIESVSQLDKRNAGDCFRMLTYAVRKGDLSIAKAFFQMENLYNAFAEGYLKGELEGNLPHMIETLIFTAAEESPESHQSSVAVIKYIYDHLVIQDRLPHLDECEHSLWFFNNNQWYFYDHSEKKTKQGDFDTSIFELFSDPINFDAIANKYELNLTSKTKEKANTSTDILPEATNTLSSSAHSRSPLPKYGFSNYKKFKNFSGTPSDFVFSHKQVAGQSQTALINQVSQYLTLSNQLENIFKIQDGICAALTHLHADLSLNEWKRFNERILKWDGTKEQLQKKDLSQDFEKLLSYITKYYFEEQAKYSYYFVGSQIEQLLEKMEQSIFLTNSWHQIVLNKTDDGDFIVYDPNFEEGLKIVKTVNEAKELIQESLGRYYLQFSEQMPNLPASKIEDANDFIKEGGLFLILRSKLNDLIAQLPEPQNIKADALKGLLVRSTSSLPLWACQTNNIELLNYIHQLVIQYIDKNPNFKNNLEKSISELSASSQRLLGLDLFYSTDTNEEFINKINTFYTVNPKKIANHQQMVRECQRNLNSIEDQFDDPIVINFFYDFMHSLKYFTSRWELISQDKEKGAIHLKNPILDAQLILEGSEKDKKDFYLEVIDKEGITKKYAVPKELEELSRSMIKRINSVYEFNLPDFSGSYRP